MYGICLLSESVSISRPKIEIERKELRPARERQIVSRRETKEIDDFCYFAAHRLFCACVIFSSPSVSPFRFFLESVLICIYIGLFGRVFANDLGDRGSPFRLSHTKDSKMVLDASLINTQHYKVRIKGKVDQSREMSSALPYSSL